ncbi:MAG TPA: oligosaccharide flippase family protein [Acidisarcina sp.]|nr:oligosaccharide flippase family protein [Acidisarcina sp.]
MSFATLNQSFNSPVNIVRRVLSVTRLRPFDTSTTEGRSRERYRRAILTTAASVFSRVITAATTLITVPLTLRYLGTERYGLWMAISSVIAVLGFSDLGISNGLYNGIAKAHGEDNHELARQYVSSAFFFLTAIAMIIGLAFAIAYPFVSWSGFFRVHSPEAVAEAGPAVAAFIGCFLLGIPTSIIGRIQAGYQEGFAGSLWGSAGGIIGLLSVLLVIHVHGSLMLLVLALAGAPMLAVLVQSIFVFRARPWLLPSWSYVTPDVSKGLLHAGMAFFLLQVAVAVSYSSDNIVLARILGPEAVTQYSIPFRLFNQVSMLCSMLMSPLWPAYGEALARQDIAWIRKTLRRSLVTSLAISVPLGLVLVVFGTKILHLWVGPKINPSLTLLIGLGIWCVLMSLSSTLATFLNGLSILSFQVKVAVVAALTNISLSIYLTYRIGVPGVLYGSILTQVLVNLIPMFLYLRNYQQSTILGQAKS